MEESGKVSSELSDILTRKKHKVAVCQTAPSFLDALNDGGIDRIVMSFDSWQHGRSMFKYFDVPVRIGSIPVTFYNTPENFVNIPARTRHEKDIVLAGAAEPVSIAETAE
jgi:hypothetical protein